MPQLTWIGKDKVENHDKELPFRVLKPNKKLSFGKEGNLLIQGDNLEALKALMPYYYNKVKCIYIDPPYNTGTEKWIYNDKVNSPQIKSWFKKIVGAEGEDLSRHDKWLCMMYPRLKLLKDLMREDGLIFISIDDNEVQHLRILLDEIFLYKNFVASIIWQKIHSTKNDAKHFSNNTEYILVYAKDINSIKINLLGRTEEMNSRYSNPDNDPRGSWQSGDLVANEKRRDGNYEVTGPNGKTFSVSENKHWVYSRTNMEELIRDNRVWFGKNGTAFPRKKRFLSEVLQGKKADTLWLSSEVGHNQEATRELKNILGDKVFNNPKPVRLIKRIISLSTNGDQGDVVLDSFAGSGTTGHAVFELNRADGGNRKFILVELEEHIAKKVTSKRLKKVVGGYEGALYSRGTGQGFEYLELNGELFDQNGFINDSVNYEDLASYVYFTETKSYLDISNVKKPFIGVFGSTNYILFFDKKGLNILDEKTLRSVSKYKGRKVIFADKCLLDEEFCEKNNIVFKQIPYELKKY